MRFPRYSTSIAAIILVSTAAHTAHAQRSPVMDYTSVLNTLDVFHQQGRLQLDIEGTSSTLGMAGCAAIAVDKTVFLAGTPSGGIGVGEHLQILDKENKQWLPIYNADGKVVTAIDVTTSIGLVAFKSADRDRKTTVAYATYGEHIDLSQVPTTAAGATGKDAGGKTAKTDEDEGSPYYTKKQLEFDYIKGYVESEQELIEVFTEAFGAKEGKKKAREAILKAMKDANLEHLIPGFLKMAREQKGS